MIDGPSDDYLADAAHYYETQLARARRRLEILAAALDKHEKKAKAVRVHWGHGGDIKVVNDKLNDLRKLIEGEE